jgi:hypothetical protein
MPRTIIINPVMIPVYPRVGIESRTFSPDHCFFFSITAVKEIVLRQMLPKKSKVPRDGLLVHFLHGGNIDCYLEVELIETVEVLRWTINKTWSLLDWSIDEQVRRCWMSFPAIVGLKEQYLS